MSQATLVSVAVAVTLMPLRFTVWLCGPIVWSSGAAAVPWSYQRKTGTVTRDLPVGAVWITGRMNCSWAMAIWATVPGVGAGVPALGAWASQLIVEYVGLPLASQQDCR